MYVADVLKLLFWLTTAYSVGYGALWLGVRLYVMWYMANGGL
jgi:hypothetical protein